MYDSRITGKTGRVKVGINSAGDVASDIKIAIDAFISNGCDWIIAQVEQKEKNRRRYLGYN